MTTAGKPMLGVALAGVLWAMSSAATAGLNYSWVEGGYPRITPDHSAKVAGGFADGSVAITSHLQLYAAYYYATQYNLQSCYAASYVSGCDTLTSSRHNYRLGFGWHTGFADHTDLLANLYYAHNAYHNARISTQTINCPPSTPCPLVIGPNPFTFGTTSDSTGDGYQLSFGLRTAPVPALEFQGLLGHQRVSNSGSSNFADAGIVLTMTRHWAFTLDWAHYFIPQNQFRLGLRYYF